MSEGQLETTYQVDPVVGWKWAVEGSSYGHAHIYSPHQNALYKLVDEASCRHGHTAPDLETECFCGFNAYSNVNVLLEREYVNNTRSNGHETVILQVELYGTVVEYEDGWRAQKQRIMTVYAPKAQMNTIRQSMAIDVRDINEIAIFSDLDQRYVSPRRYLESLSEAYLCEVCLSPISYDDWHNDGECFRCYTHDKHLFYGVWMTPEEMLKALSAGQVCEICLVPVYPEEDPKCPRCAGAYRDVPDETRGENTDFIEKIDKRGQRYWHESRQVSWNRQAHHTQVRGVLVFRNETSWTVKVILQTRIVRNHYDIVYPCRMISFVLLDRSPVLFRRFKGKLRKSSLKDEKAIRTSNIYSLVWGSIRKISNGLYPSVRGSESPDPSEGSLHDYYGPF